MHSQRTITLVETSDGWTATDEATGLECSGEERAAVLSRLDDAVAVSFDDAEDENETAADGGEDEAALDWFEE